MSVCCYKVVQLKIASVVIYQIQESQFDHVLESIKKYHIQIIQWGYLVAYDMLRQTKGLQI